MRLMLGTRNIPNLLIDVEKIHGPGHFDFWVVNGAWNGTYYNGYVTIWHPSEPYSSLDKIDILTDNQDRLRGDYNDVFINFCNTEYVAPKSKPLPSDWEDDIPF